MADSDPTDGLAVLAGRARAALATPPPAPDVEEAVYAGSAADDRVRAEVDARGVVRSVTVDPAIYAAGTAEIAAAARVAINAALDARPAAPDLAPLVDQVRAAQEYARRTLAEVSGRMAEVANHVHRAHGGTD